MVSSEIILIEIIVIAFSFPVAIYALLGRFGSGYRSVQAFAQAIRWVTAGVWVGVILATAQEQGALSALVVALLAVGGLTVSEYRVLGLEAQAREQFDK